MKRIKFMKIVILILISVFLIYVAVFFYRRYKTYNHIDNGVGMINSYAGAICGVRFDMSGGKNGRLKHYKITVQEDGTALLEYEYQQDHWTDAESGTAVLDKEDFFTFRKICHKTQCLLCHHKGKPDGNKVLDGPSTTITFFFPDGKMEFYHNYIYPLKEDGLFEKVEAHFDSLISKAKDMQSDLG